MGFLSFFKGQKPKPSGVIIRNRLGEQIDRVEGVWDLANADLRDRQWAHAELSGLSLAGANCEGINLLGARLVRTSFSRTNLKNANLAYSLVDGTNFHRADLDGVDLLHTSVRLTQLDGANITPASTIPGIRVVWA